MFFFNLITYLLDLYWYCKEKFCLGHSITFDCDISLCLYHSRHQQQNYQLLTMATLAQRQQCQQQTTQIKHQPHPLTHWQGLILQHTQANLQVYHSIPWPQQHQPLGTQQSWSVLIYLAHTWYQIFFTF